MAGTTGVLAYGTANRDWEGFVTVERGPLKSGMAIHFYSRDGYLVSTDTGSDQVFAHDESPGPATRFRIVKVNGREGDETNSGDRVALQVYNAKWASVSPSANAVVQVDRNEVGPWGEFQITI